MVGDSRPLDLSESQYDTWRTRTGLIGWVLEMSIVIGVYLPLSIRLHNLQSFMAAWEVIGGVPVKLER